MDSLEVSRMAAVFCFSREKIEGCLWNTTVCPGGKKVEKAIFSFNVKFKITKSLTLVSFERASLVEYTCQIWSLYLLRFKSYRRRLKLTTDRQTDRQTNKQTERQTDRQTGQKQYAPEYSIRGHKNWYPSTFRHKATPLIKSKYKDWILHFWVS